MATGDVDDRCKQHYVCRFCPNTGESVSLYNASNFPSATPLTEILFELSQVSITPDDGFPQHICKEKCLARLLDFYLFKQQIRLAEEQRRNSKIVSNPKIDIEFVTDEDQYEAEFLIDDEDNRSSSEEKQLLISTDNLLLPPQEMIVTHLEFDNFDYIEYQGEKCCKCDAFFRNQQDLEIHAQRVHGTSELIPSTDFCRICTAQFHNDADLKKHIERVKSKDIYLCKVCLQIFQDKRTFINHMETHQLIKNDGIVENSERCTNLDRELTDLPATDGEEIDADDQPRSNEENNPRIPPKFPDKSLISSVEDYEQHQIIRMDNAERCCGCGMFFESFEKLQNHAQYKHHVEEIAKLQKPYCEICHEKFKASWALNAHKTHCRYVKELYYCKLCKIVYSRKFNIIKHFQTTPGHIAETGIFNSPGFVTSIKRQTKIIQGFSCCFLKCSNTFESEQMLLDHVEEQHAPRRKLNLSERISDDHVCTICKRSFGSQQLLLLHRNRSTKKKHICSYCGESFLTPSTLREHELLAHCETIPQHPCDICDKTFRTKNLLKAHRLTHDQGKDFSCTQCEAQFRFRFQLKKHVQGVHPTCFPYECKYCVKKFSTKAKHDLHLRSHTGEKPYTCRHDSCGKQFSHVTDRKRHEMGVHTGERPYRCDKCSAAYIRKRELLIHLQKHPIGS